MSAPDDLGFDLPEPAKVPRARLFALAALAVVVLAGAFLAAWLPRRHARAELEAAAKSGEAAPMKVTVVAPKAGSSDRSIALPGTIDPLEETVIYPRANGYVRKWEVDIGDKVKEGAVLAEIDTPELDQELDQARAQLAQADAQLVQAKAKRDYANTALGRFTKLAPSGVASQQELDQSKAEAEVAEANVVVAEANVKAQQANIGRLAKQKSFSRVTAPFGGTVSARTIERGALVSPTTPLFKIAATDPVRVLVHVPQDVAPSVRVDVPAKVSIREFPGRAFDGKVARAAGALDPQTRTMTTEVRVPNPDGQLLAGMYAEVALTLPVPHRIVEIPATALLSDAKGQRVAVVGKDGKLHLVPVVVERDTGKSLDIASGLSGDERVVSIASADLVEGRPVEVVAQ